ncbi:AsmA family protein [Propylenella binzhouense]|nr:AsmA family protein [Propylenella binzhouense]
MRRILWGVAALALLLAAILAIALASLPREMVKTRVAEQVSAWTGRDVSVRGEPEFRLFPEPSVTLRDVRVDGPPGMREGAILTSDELTGTIRILPLVLGDVEIKSFNMVRPVVTLVRDETGRRNWVFDAGAAALQLAFAGDVPLGHFRIEDGTIRYADRQSGATEALEHVGVTVDWPSVRGTLSVSGSAVWRGQKVDLQGSADRPFAFARRRSSPLELKLDAPSLHFRFDGSISDLRRPQIVGDLDLTTPSLRQFAGWLGSAIGPGPNLQQASLSGQAEVLDGSLTMTNAALMLDGNRAAGAIRIGFGPHPVVDGTLAFPALNLSPYFQEISDQLGSNPDAWREIDLDTSWYRALNADVRLSAKSVAAGQFEAGATAATAVLRDGRLEVGIAQAAFYEGTLSGTIAVTDDPRSERFDVEAQLRATDVSLAQVVRRVAPASTIAGRATIAGEIATEGANAGELVAGLSGAARAKIDKGNLPTFGLSALAAALREGRPLSAAPVPSVAPVDSARASIRFESGSALVDNLTLLFGANEATLDGAVDLDTGALALAGTMSAGTAAAAEFGVTGTLSDPVLKTHGMP